MSGGSQQASMMELLMDQMNAILDSQKEMGEQISKIASKTETMQTHLSEMDRKVSRMTDTLARRERGQDVNASNGNPNSAVGRFYSRAMARQPEPSSTRPTPQSATRISPTIYESSAVTYEEGILFGSPSAVDWAATGDERDGAARHTSTRYNSRLPGEADTVRATPGESSSRRTPCINDLSAFMASQGGDAFAFEDGGEIEQLEANRQTYSHPEREREDGGARVRAATPPGRLQNNKESDDSGSDTDERRSARTASRPGGAPTGQPHAGRSHARAPSGSAEPTRPEATAASAEPPKADGVNPAPPTTSKTSTRTRPVRTRYISDPLPTWDRADKTVMPYLNKETIALMQKRIHEKEDHEDSDE